MKEFILVEEKIVPLQQCQNCLIVTDSILGLYLYMKCTREHIAEMAHEMSAGDFIFALTDGFLEYVGGGLTAENMGMLNTWQHTLLAYRYMLEEVMEGGFIQLIQNGYAGYVLEGPFPLVLKKEWGMKDLAKLIYDVKREYHRHADEFDDEMSDADFMAVYEKLDVLNEYGDAFLDDFQENSTPKIRDFVVENAVNFELG